MAIKTFADETTQDIFHGLNTRAARMIPQRVWGASRRKLQLLETAKTIADLTMPGMRYEPLKYTRPGFHSIRINDQYRVEFQWAYDAAIDPKDPTKRSGNAYSVEITDDHRR